MKLEVHSAADFLMNLLRVKQGTKSPDDNQLQGFKGSLESLLVLRYRSHWYPDVPTKGSGYRCIRINGKMDPLIAQAGVSVGLTPNTLRKMLPPELTLWIDPEEVAYRIGENGSICVLYDSQSRASPSSDLDSTGSGSNLSTDEFIMERVGRMEVSDYLEQNASYSPASSTSSSISNSANCSPTKPTTMPSMQDGRYFAGNNANNGFAGHSSPFRGAANKFHHQQQQHQQQQAPLQQQNHQFHRQHINGNNIHQQHPYMHQAQPHQWEGFGSNNNKVSVFIRHISFVISNLLPVQIICTEIPNPSTNTIMTSPAKRMTKKKKN